MIRVVHLIAPAEYGGAESVVRTLAAGKGGSTRHDVAVLVQNDAPHAFVDRLVADGLGPIQIRSGRRRYSREVRDVADAVRSVGGDVLHTHVYHADIVGYLAARRCGIPVVATTHGFTGGDWKNRLYEWVDVQALKRFDRVICVSDTMRQRLLGRGLRRERLRVIHNALASTPQLDREEARRRLGLPAEARIIGWVGRLSYEKGADILLDVLGATKDPDLTVAIVGDGPERNAIIDRATAMNAGSTRIHVLGSVLDASSVLLAFDALAITSRTEGLPITLLEALQARVPVIAFAVGGIPEVVSDDCAWLAEPGDVGSLARRIEERFANPPLAAEKAERARAIVVERFGVAQCLRELDEVYESLGSR